MHHPQYTMLDGEDNFTPTPSPPPLPPDGNGPQYAVDTGMLLTARPLRPFKSSEEYLWAMKEDLAEWLNNLYGLDIGPEDFMERLETGETLCRHANQVRRLALERQRSGRNGFPAPVPAKEVVFRAGVVAGTFLARDNVSNFIAWCRALGIYECLLFETDDLVLRKNERSFILCLLEVGRRGAKFGMPAPLLVQLEQEIDREIAKDNAKKKGGSNDDDDEDYDLDYEEDLEPEPQIITNDLMNLDEMVRFLVNRCTCPVQFPMHRVSDGKYRIGDTQMLIFVRILRSHVMVRVGGGWDTLEHYLDKHDPCRCKQGHRVTVGSKVVVQRPIAASPALPHMQVTYERTPDSFMRSSTPSSGGGIRGTPGSPQRLRRASLTSNKSSTGSLASTGSERANHEGDQITNGDQLARRLSLGARQPTSTVETDSSPRQRPPSSKGSRIPGPDESQWPPLSRRRRSQSSDHLADEMPELEPRRLSAEAWAGGRKGSMTRSRSQCSEDSEMATFAGRRSSPGRHSCRGPRTSPSPSRLPRACTSNQSQTWSCRTRDARPALAPDLFKPPNNNNPSSSPNSRRALAPLVHEVLAAAASDEQLLRRMEQIVQQYRGRLDQAPAPARAPVPPEFPRATYTRQWVARHGSPSLASPEESSSTGEGEGIERTPVRVSPRRDPVPGPTRIPVPTFYSSA